jgi:hypothetical protein
MARCSRFAPSASGTSSSSISPASQRAKAGVWSRVSSRVVPSGERESTRTSPTCALIQAGPSARVGTSASTASAHPIPARWRGSSSAALLTAWSARRTARRASSWLRIGAAASSASSAVSAASRPPRSPPIPSATAMRPVSAKRSTA